MTHRSILLALWVVLAASAEAQLRPSSLDEVLARADTTNPRILSARRSADAAAAAVPQAGAFPDPTLGFGLMNVPIADPSLSREMMTMTQVQVGTMVPWPGKRGLREDVATLRAEAADWDVQRARDEVEADVRTAFYSLYFVEQALEVTERNVLLLEDFASLTATRYAVGTAAQPDVLKAQVERTRLADQYVALEARRAAVRARLNALLSRPTETPLPPVGLPGELTAAALAPGETGTRFVSAALRDVLAPGAGEGALPSVVELQEAALAQSPVLRAHLLRITAEEQQLALARTATRPDVRVSANYSQRSGFADFFSLMVSAPIPVFAGRKQAQGVAQQAAVVQAQDARYTSMVDDLNARIASLHASLVAARDRLVLLDDGILPQANTALASASSSYQVGRVDFLTLLDAQVTLYRHELEYHRLLSDFAKDVATLELVTGTEVLR